MFSVSPEACQWTRYSIVYTLFLYESIWVGASHGFYRIASSYIMRRPNVERICTRSKLNAAGSHSTRETHSVDMVLFSNELLRCDHELVQSTDYAERS